MATVFATEDFRLSNLVKKELWDEFGWTRLVVTVNEAAAKNYVVGTVLGKVTATGKFKAAVETAVDGSKTPAAIVLGSQAIPATTDTKVLVMVKGPAIVSKSALVLDATYNDATKLATAYAALESLNIAVNDAV